MPLHRVNIAIIKLQVTIYFVLQKYSLKMNAYHSKLQHSALGILDMPVSHQYYHEKSYINQLSVYIAKNLIFIQNYYDGSKTGQRSFKMC